MTAIDWSTTPGLVLDPSALLTHRKALRLVLTAVHAWQASLMYAHPERHKLNIIDEAWIALEDLAIVRYLQDQWRLGRQWGCANLLITHAVADLRSQTDDGSAQGKIAARLSPQGRRLRSQVSLRGLVGTAGRGRRGGG
jgi:hypothetical protein